jgi:hypothetical protein
MPKESTKNEHNYLSKLQNARLTEDGWDMSELPGYNPSGGLSDGSYNIG